MRQGADARSGRDPGAHGRNRALGLFVVCLGALVGPLDTAVNVAFPAMTTAFGLALRDIQWVVITFVIAQSTLTIVFGRLGDVYGHRRIFAIGLAASVVAHLATGFAPDYGWLVALRVVQGVAVALAVACAPALATLLYPPEQKRRVLAIYLAAFSFGLALGPLAGGALIDWVGWPGVFWFRAPIALLALALLPLLADARSPARTDTRMFPKLDALRSPAFAAIQFAAVAISFASFAILLLVPYALAAWPGQTMTASGALLALFPGGALLGGLVATRAAQRFSSPAMIRLGMIATATGLVATAIVLPETSSFALGVALMLTGLGLGLFQVGYLDATTSMLPPEDRGVAGSLMTVTRLLGIVLGVTGISALHERLGSFETTIAAMGVALLAFGAIALFIRRR